MLSIWKTETCISTKHVKSSWRNLLSAVTCQQCWSLNLRKALPLCIASDYRHCAHDLIFYQYEDGIMSGRQAVHIPWFRETEMNSCEGKVDVNLDKDWVMKETESTKISHANLVLENPEQARKSFSSEYSKQIASWNANCNTGSTTLTPQLISMTSQHFLTQSCLPVQLTNLSSSNQSSSFNKKQAFSTKETSTT